MKTPTTSAVGALLLISKVFPSQADNHVRWKRIIGINQANDVVGGITGVLSVVRHATLKSRLV